MAESRPDDAVLRDIVAALRDSLGARLTAIVLFGSRALGTAHEGSDWDLLVIAEELPSPAFERHKQMKRALPPLVRGAVSCIAKTPGEFEASLPSLYLDIALDGRILYDPRGYARQKLDELRTMIRHAGLTRTHTPAGDWWAWAATSADGAPVGARRLDWSR